MGLGRAVIETTALCSPEILHLDRFGRLKETHKEGFYTHKHSITRDNKLTAPVTHLRKREQDMRLACNAISLSIKKKEGNAGLSESWDTALSNLSQSETDKYCVLPFIGKY